MADSIRHRRSTRVVKVPDDASSASATADHAYRYWDIRSSFGTCCCPNVIRRQPVRMLSGLYWGSRGATTEDFQLCRDFACSAVRRTLLGQVGGTWARSQMRPARVVRGVIHRRRHRGAQGGGQEWPQHSHFPTSTSGPVPKIQGAKRRGWAQAHHESQVGTGKGPGRMAVRAGPEPFARRNCLWFRWPAREQGWGFSGSGYRCGLVMGEVQPASRSTGSPAGGQVSLDRCHPRRFWSVGTAVALHDGPTARFRRSQLDRLFRCVTRSCRLSPTKSSYLSIPVRPPLWV